MGPWDSAPPGAEAPGPEPKRRGSRVWIRVLVIAAVLAVVAGLALYVLKVEIKLQRVTYRDDAVDVVLIEPVSPPAARPAPGTARGPNGDVPPTPEP